MAERDMRARVMRALDGLHPVAVENRAAPGTPDVNYVGGWLELKWLRSWPSRAATPVRVAHFNMQQRLWHLRRRDAGGKTWVLLQCRREWFLFDGAVAAMELGFWPHGTLPDLAAFYSNTGLWGDFRACVSAEQRRFSLTDNDVARISRKLHDGIA